MPPSIKRFRVINTNEFPVEILLDILLTHTYTCTGTCTRTRTRTHTEREREERERERDINSLQT